MTPLNHRLAALSLIILIVLLTGYYFYPQESGEERTSVTLIISFGDSGKLFSGNITVWGNGRLLSSEESGDNTTTFEFHGLEGENQTVFSALLSASECGNFSVEYSRHSLPKGVFVESIAGVENGEKNWQYYLNNEYGSRASDDMRVKNNDIIEWSYE